MSTRHIPTQDLALCVQPLFKDSSSGLQLFNGSAMIHQLQQPANAMLHNKKVTYLEETLWLLQCRLCHWGQPRAHGDWPSAPV